MGGGGRGGRGDALNKKKHGPVLGCRRHFGGGAQVPRAVLIQPQHAAHACAFLEHGGRSDSYLFWLYFWRLFGACRRRKAEGSKGSDDGTGRSRWDSSLWHLRIGPGRRCAPEISHFSKKEGTAAQRTTCSCPGSTVRQAMVRFGLQGILAQTGKSRKTRVTAPADSQTAVPQCSHCHCFPVRACGCGRAHICVRMGLCVLVPQRAS